MADWKNDHRKTYNEWRRNYRQVIRYAIHWYKMVHPCIFCGQSDPNVLTFDHVVGTKRFTIGGPGGGDSLHRVWEEISKCVVRCFNCHMLVTKGRLIITSLPVMTTRFQNRRCHKGHCTCP